MRNRYLVTYDISDEKRLRRVFKCMRGYGDPLQYSVFRCDLSPREKILMVEDLCTLTNHEKDKILLVNLGPAEGNADLRVEFLGRKDPPAIRSVVVI